MEDEAFFEIADTGNFLRLTLFEDSIAVKEWDKDWIKTKIEVKAGAFSGWYNAELFSNDLSYLKNNLTYLYDHLNWSTMFKAIEHNLEINITGDGLGHLVASCTVSDRVGYSPYTLKFDLNFDQTQLMPMVTQLKAIISRHAMLGEPNNKIRNRKSQIRNQFHSSSLFINPPYPSACCHLLPGSK